jgi:hypothetical protein
LAQGCCFAYLTNPRIDISWFTGWVVATATVDVIQPGQWKGKLISSYIEKKGNFTENSDIPSNIASSIYSLGVALIVIMLMLILNRFIPLLDVTRRSRYK